MNPEDVEKVLSVVLARWYVGRHPDQDVVVMRLRELGSAEHGVEVTVGDDSFRVIVEVP